MNDKLNYIEGKQEHRLCSVPVRNCFILFFDSRHRKSSESIVLPIQNHLIFSARIKHSILNGILFYLYRSYIDRHRVPGT